jgi:peptide/nickel transport system substrate-binding protein
MTFFNTSTPILSDASVRQALVYGTNRAELVKQLGFTALTASGPLLRGQVGYDPAIVQAPYSIEEAGKLLDAAGWRVSGDGLRKKADQSLKLRFVSQNVAEYAAISQSLQKQWKLLGIELDVKIRPEEEMQNDTLNRHDYDVLLYGIAIGRDPDVFAYWHSSQTDIRSKSRLNLSEYKNKNADKSLEAGRTRLEPNLRALKYKPFLTAWRDDAPAIALYQPRFLYITRSELVGFNTIRIGSTIDRLNTIQNEPVTQSTTALS